MMEQKEANKEAKPFSSKSFFLDLTGFGGIKTLSEDIKLLGGIVEGFLSREVNCVITNKVEGKNKAPNSNKPAATLSPRPSTSKIDFTAKKPPLTPGSDIISRGKSILQKASKVEGNCGVLQNAKKWGIDIISINDMLTIIDKHKVKLRLKHNLPHKSGNYQSPHSRRLREPFIKFEAKSRQFRPAYVEFASWPKSIFSSDKYIISKSTNARQTKSHSIVTAHRQKERFCEICSLAFHDMQKHVNSDQHRKSISDNNRYSPIDKLIDQSCSLDSYLNDLHSDYSSVSDMMEMEFVSPRERSLSAFEDDIRVSPVTPITSSNFNNMKRKNFEENHLNIPKQCKRSLQDAMTSDSCYKNKLKRCDPITGLVEEMRDFVASSVPTAFRTEKNERCSTSGSEILRSRDRQRVTVDWSNYSTDKPYIKKAKVYKVNSSEDSINN